MSRNLLTDSITSANKLPLLSETSFFKAGEEVLLLPLNQYDNVKVENSTPENIDCFASYLAQACQDDLSKTCESRTIFSERGYLLDAVIFQDGEMQWVDRDVLIVLADGWHAPTVPVLYRGRYSYDFINSLSAEGIVLPLHERKVKGQRVIARTSSQNR